MVPDAGPGPIPGEVMTMRPNPYLSPYSQGEEAFKAGEPQESNPYEEGEDAYLDWSEGWDDAACEAGV